MYDFSLIDIPATGVNYTLWLKPLTSNLLYHVEVTENVPLAQDYVKLKSIYGDFILEEGDYLNFQGRVVLVKKTTLITTSETILPIYNIYELYAGDFTSTFALSLVASDANSSVNNTYENKSSNTKETGLWSRKAVIKRESEIEFEGAFIKSDRLTQYLFKKKKYYFELRNPVYFADRIGTYMGYVEGVLTTPNEKLVTLKGQLVARSKFQEWALVGELNNPYYCNSYLFNHTSHVVSISIDTVLYCPLDTSILDVDYDIIVSQDTANYCPLDITIFN